MNSNRPQHFINSQYSNNQRPHRLNKTPYDRPPQTGNRFPNSVRLNSNLAASNSAGRLQNYRFQSPQALRQPGGPTQVPRQPTQLIRAQPQFSQNAPAQNQAANKPQIVQRSQSQPVRPQQQQNRPQHQSVRPPQLLVRPQQQQQQTDRSQPQSIRPQLQPSRPQQQTIPKPASTTESRTSTPTVLNKTAPPDNSPKQPSPANVESNVQTGAENVSIRTSQTSPVADNRNDINKSVTGNVAVLATPSGQQTTKSVPCSPQLRLQRPSQQPQRSERSRQESQSSDDRNANSRTNVPAMNRSYQQRNNMQPNPRSNMDRSLSSSSNMSGRGRFNPPEQSPGDSGQQQQSHRNQMHNFGSPNKMSNSSVRFGERSLDSKKGGPSNDGSKMSGGRTRLFFGNIPTDLSESELQELSRPHGTVVETFVNSQRGFAFVRYDRRVSAEIAKAELDNITIRGKVIRVRFAVNGAAIRVRNIPDFVSNELLAEAFSYFGRIERAVVIVDDRGKPTGEGVVEFDRKNSALACISKCSENCFVLTNDLKPVSHRACHPHSDFKIVCSSLADDKNLNGQSPPCEFFLNTFCIKLMSSQNL